MFEFNFTDSNATIYIEKKDGTILREYGFEINAGWLPLSATEGINLYKELENMKPSVSKYLLKRWEALMNQIKYGFGPEFELHLND